MAIPATATTLGTQAVGTIGAMPLQSRPIPREWFISVVGGILLVVLAGVLAIVGLLLIFGLVQAGLQIFSLRSVEQLITQAVQGTLGVNIAETANETSDPDVDPRVTDRTTRVIREDNRREDRQRTEERQTNNGTDGGGTDGDGNGNGNN